MKSIYYASNMQSDLFPLNTRSNFECFIHQQDLNYISSGDIEIAIKSITFDNDLYNRKPLTLALKTNLSFESVSSYGWDNIVSIFTAHPRPIGIQQIQFNNPTFFPTNHHKLSRSSFKIIDVDTGESPNFSIGSPTFIEVVVRKSANRMKTPFHILLDSSCVESKKRFPKNTNMEFCIQLPKRMEFQKDWMVCLKSIHFTNRFYTLQNCSFTISGERPEGNRWMIEGGILKKFPNNMNKVILLLNRLTKGYVVFLQGMNNRVFISLASEFKEKATIFGTSLTITFSSDMLQILGFDSKQSAYTLDENNPTISSQYRADVFSLHPRHFIVCCDLVEESILGGQRVQVLKYFPRKLSTDKSVDLEFVNNDYLKLNLKNFDRIHIRIADLTGETIQCDQDTATRMQLLFVNTNSA